MSKQLEIMKKNIGALEADDARRVRKAISVMLQENRFSVSLAQRRLRVGYFAALTLCEDLQKMGIIGSDFKPEVSSYPLLISVKDMALLAEEEAFPEWYHIIKRVLREYECYSQRMFEDNGGYQAYSELKFVALREMEREDPLRPSGTSPKSKGDLEEDQS